MFESPINSSRDLVGFKEEITELHLHLHWEDVKSFALSEYCVVDGGFEETLEVIRLMTMGGTPRPDS